MLSRAAPGGTPDDFTYRARARFKDQQRNL
jgi:hypothetical protein